MLWPVGGMQQDRHHIGTMVTMAPCLRQCNTLYIMTILFINEMLGKILEELTKEDDFVRGVKNQVTSAWRRS
jgi:hypothetical protein